MSSRLFTPAKKKRRGAYFNCETCGIEFYAFPSLIRQARTNGMIRFCSIGCYDKTGNSNPFWGKNHTQQSIDKMSSHPNRPKFKTGEDNPNFIRYGEEYGFNGTSKHWWKRKLLAEIGKCEDCNYSDKRILHIHHKDRRPENNVRENLELLCPNCHYMKHFLANDGPYWNLSNE